MIGNSYWTDHSSKPMHHEMYVKKNYLIWRFLTDSLKGFFPSTLNSHSFCNYWLDRLEVSIEISFIHLKGTIKWPYQLLEIWFYIPSRMNELKQWLRRLQGKFSPWSVLGGIIERKREENGREGKQWRVGGLRN